MTFLCEERVHGHFGVGKVGSGPWLKKQDCQASQWTQLDATVGPTVQSKQSEAWRRK